MTIGQENFLMGMRKAKKKGRWMGVAPICYANKVTADRKKYIASVELEASVIKSVFAKLYEGQLNMKQIVNLAFSKGTKTYKANFWNLFMNPVC